MTFLTRINLLSNPIKAPWLIPLFSRTNRAAIASKTNCYFLCTQSLDKPEIVNKLVSIFTTPNFHLDTQELAYFGSKLTTDVVEASLKGFENWKIALRFFYWASTQSGYKHNCYTYNAMASILSGARQNTPLRDLARDLIDSRCDMSPGALGFFVRCLGSQGLVEEAGTFFDQVKKMGLCAPTSYSYNALLEGISKSGSIELLETRLSEMREDGWQLDKYTLTPVLQCYCNAADIEKASTVFYQMNDRGWVDSRVFTMLVLSFSKWGKVDKAFDLIERMEDFKINLNEKTFYVLIHGFVRQNRVDKALQLFDKMQNSRFVPGISLYSVLIEGLCKNKEFEKALQLFSQMNELGIVPDVNLLTVLVSSLSAEREMISIFMATRKSLVDKKSFISLYNSTLSILVNNDSTDKAYHLLRAVLNRGGLEDSLVMAEEIVFPDTTSFNIVLDGLCQKGKVDVALDLFEDLIERMEDFKINLNEKMFYVLIHGFVRQNRVDKALQLFDKMQSSRFVPGISLYSVLIEGLCKNKEFEKALQLFSQMNELGIVPDVNLLTVLVSSLSAESEMISLFMATRKSLVDKKSFISLYNSTLSSLVNKGSTDKAYHLLRAVLNGGGLEVDGLVMAEEIVFPNTTSFNIVLDGLYQKGEVDVALGLFKDMDQIGCPRSLLLYNNLINALSSSNRMDECYELLAEMKNLGFRPTQFTYNSMLGCLCQREDVAGALHLLQEMRAHGHEPWIKNYTLLVKKLCRNRRAVDSCEFLDKMVQEGFVPNIIAYSAAIDGLLKMQEVDRALRLFREICARGHFPDLVAHNTIINGLCKAKRLLEAQDVFNKMVEKGLVPSVVTYNLLIDACCKNGDIDQAIACLSRMTREQREPNVFSYTTLINGLCSVGRAEEAIVLWNEMVGKGKEKEKGCPPNPIAFMAFIHGLCKCRMPDSALIYFLEMEEKQMNPDSYVYVALIEAFILDSNAPLALDILRKMIQHEKYPDLLDKNSPTVRNAVAKLLIDARTSSIIKNLIAEGIIPTDPNVSDVAD